MLELLDVFDVRPADEEEGEEDEDWVIGGGLVVPGRREELDGESRHASPFALSFVLSRHGFFPILCISLSNLRLTLI